MNRFLPILVFLLVASLGLAMTGVVYRAEIMGEQKRFEILADDAVVQLEVRLNQHVALLVSTRSLFSATGGQVNGVAFKRFISGLDINDTYAGIQGIGYAPFIQSGEELVAELAIANNYNIDTQITPKSEEQYRTPIVLLEPQDVRNQTALGYDMFHQETRREAIIRAWETGKVAASGPVELVQEITAAKQVGFLVYLPFVRANITTFAKNDVRGFIFAPFRAGDLHRAALSQEELNVVALQSKDGDTVLFETNDFASGEAQFMVTRELNIAGRTWTINMHEKAAFYSTFPHLSSLILGTLSAVLAFALSIAIVAQQNAVRQAHKVKDVVEETLKEKDMLLQEMRHRIKNSIARVLAISRQTANNSETIEQFSTSFSARLHAMASSQDLLTRSKWQRADLEALLHAELQQVFGEGTEHYSLTGPKTELNEQATQAIGLVCHELATNALKYGGVSEENGKLDVAWKVSGKRLKRTLQMTWQETSPTALPPTENKGFGTKLIDANIRGELGGTVEREYNNHGLTVTINIPLKK